ncbi:MAG TPA: ABC transporter substrate-binding protein [Thermomicrobiales bacterium]|nr:ABC transporter substrate-binding protein [Thermomicrobiales bacterium]
MTHEDSLRHLLDDLQDRNLDRRSFMQRATALGLSARAIGVLLGAAGTAVPAAIMTASAQEAGGKISFAVSTDPETLDLHNTSNGSAWTVFDNIYSSLFYQDLDLSFKGLLADSWEVSEDNLEIAVKLREGVTFHDGSEFNADSVKYTFERLAEVGAKNPNFEMAGAITVEVVDPYNVKLVFEEPNAAFFNAFTGGYGGMLAPEATEAAGDQYGREPIGTNAYKLKDWQTGSTVTLEAFDDFVGVQDFYKNTGRPYIDEMVYKVIPESFAQVASLETGEVDTVELTATDLPRFENDDRFEIFSARLSQMGYLGLTRTRPMMEDPRVRTAVAHGIDRDEIVNTIFEGGLAEPCSTPLPPSLPGYNAELEAKSPAFDIDAAKALLDEAGWVESKDGIREKDGEALKPQLYTNTATTSGQLATLIQGQLRKIGMEVEIHQLETAALLDFTPRGEHDMLLLSWGWSDPDVLYLFLSTDRLATSNRVHYSNPDFDALLVEGQQTIDQDARMEVYYKAQEILLEDLPWVPLYMPIGKTAVAKRVKGVQIFPGGDGSLLLNDAWIED